MNQLELKNITLSYGNNQVIKNFSLSVEKGSFTTLLGASGSGKTTLLRIIAGFLQADSGSVFIDGIDQSKVEVNRRQVGMVFQDYALFPHMTVRQNLAYGLKIQKLDKKKIQTRIQEISRVLDIENLLDRYPHELSGGQQQRVALGRAIVLEPKILLMDEPLSSLDAKLREKVREELKEIQQKLKITTIYVTHDQEEALSLSDKIAVLNEGELVQYGTPFEVYFEPKDRFTADFTGRANFLAEGENTRVVRPDWFELGTVEDHDICGKVEEFLFFGTTLRYKISAGENKNLIADIKTLDENPVQKGELIYLKIQHAWML